MKLAVLQMQAVCGEPERNLRLIEDAMVRAAKDGADLLLAPELAVTGYGAGTIMRDLAQPADGEWISRLKRCAIEAGIAVIAGFPERSSADIHNSAVFLGTDAKAEPVVHRKSRLYGDYEKRLFRAPPTETVLVRVRGITLGLLICYEVEFPEDVRRLAVAGAQAVLVPTALPAGPHASFIAGPVVSVRAFENQIFVAYANHAGHDSTFTYAGLSQIAAPDGQTLSAASGDERVMLLADLQPDRFALSRRANPYLEQLAAGP